MDNNHSQIKNEESSIQSGKQHLKNISSYLWNVTTTVSQTVISSIPHHQTRHSSNDNTNNVNNGLGSLTNEKEDVLYSKFVNLNNESNKRIYLLLGRVNGFQIYFISGNEEPTLISNFTKEGLGSVTQMEMISLEKLVLFADSGDQTKSILIVDIDSSKILLTIPAPSSNISHIEYKHGHCLFSCNEENSIFIYNAKENWKLIHTIYDFQAVPHISLHKSFDFGSKYLVYSSNEPSVDDLDSLRQSAEKLTMDIVHGLKTVVESGTHLVKTYAQEYFKTPEKIDHSEISANEHQVHLSYQEKQKEEILKTEKGLTSHQKSEIQDQQQETLTLQRSLTPEYQEDNSPKRFGFLKIFDLKTLQVLDHWKAHTNVIANICFSPCETYFLTHSTVANNFYIWSMLNKGIGGSANTLLNGYTKPHKSPFLHIPMYKLERGYTSATVQSIAFSSDSKWVAVTTSHGTTHLYLIHPSGKHYIHGLLSYHQDLAVVNGFKDAYMSPAFKIYKSLYKDTFGSKKGNSNANAHGGSGNSCVQREEFLSATEEMTINVYPIARVKHVQENSASSWISFLPTTQESAEPQNVASFLCSSFLPGFTVLENDENILLLPTHHHHQQQPLSPVSKGRSNIDGPSMQDNISLILRQQIVFYHRNGVLKKFYCDSQSFANIKIKQEDGSHGNSYNTTGNPYGLSKSLSNHSGSFQGWTLTGQMLLSSIQSFEEGSVKRQKPMVHIHEVSSRVLGLQEEVKRQDGTKLVAMEDREDRDKKWVPHIQTQTFDVALYGQPVWNRPKFRLATFSHRSHGINVHDGVVNEINGSQNVKSPTEHDSSPTGMTSVSNSNNHGHNVSTGSNQAPNSESKSKSKKSAAKLKQQQKEQQQLVLQPTENLSSLEEKNTKMRSPTTNQNKIEEQSTQSSFFPEETGSSLLCLQVRLLKVLRSRFQSKNTVEQENGVSDISMDVSLAMDSGLSNSIPIPNAYDISFEDACLIDE